jgi:hypothetical protein
VSPSIAKELGVTLPELFEFDQSPKADREHRRKLSALTLRLAKQPDEIVDAVAKMLESLEKSSTRG